MSAIAARGSLYLERYPTDFAKAALSSPMLEPATPFLIPQELACGDLKVMLQPGIPSGNGRGLGTRKAQMPVRCGHEGAAGATPEPTPRVQCSSTSLSR